MKSVRDRVELFSWKRAASLRGLFSLPFRVWECVHNQVRVPVEEQVRVQVVHVILCIMELDEWGL